MPSAQIRNAEMINLARADLLNAADRNIAFFAYNSATSLSFSSGFVALDTQVVNTAPTVYALASNIFTILEAGVYKFTVKVTVGHGSGSANLVAALTLDEDPNTGSYAAVPGSLSYWGVLGASYASGHSTIIRRVLPDYKYKIAVSRQSTTDSLVMLALTCTLNVERLYKLG